MPIIAPSLLAADFLKLDQECTMLNESEADWYHLDVMDGRFVPNINSTCGSLPAPAPQYSTD